VPYRAGGDAHWPSGLERLRTALALLAGEETDAGRLARRQLATLQQAERIGRAMKQI
jgi:hypothetical protein